MRLEREVRLLPEVKVSKEVPWLSKWRNGIWIEGDNYALQIVSNVEICRDSKDSLSGAEDSAQIHREKRSFRHSLLRVGSDKYLTNRKINKGKFINRLNWLIRCNKLIVISDSQEQSLTPSRRPRISLRKKSFSVDTELMSDQESTLRHSQYLAARETHKHWSGFLGGSNYKQT